MQNSRPGTGRRRSDTDEVVERCVSGNAPRRDSYRFKLSASRRPPIFDLCCCVGVAPIFRPPCPSCSHSPRAQKQVFSVSRGQLSDCRRFGAVLGLRRREVVPELNFHAALKSIWGGSFGAPCRNQTLRVPVTAAEQTPWTQPRQPPCSADTQAPLQRPRRAGVEHMARMLCSRLRERIGVLVPPLHAPGLRAAHRCVGGFVVRSGGPPDGGSDGRWDGQNVGRTADRAVGRSVDCCQAASAVTR